MTLHNCGPFANTVIIAGALVAAFAFFLLKMVGRVKRWTWLTSDSPPFLVTAGSRALAVALMAVTYVTINSSNYGWFAVAAVASAILCFICISRFDYLRKLYFTQVPLVGHDGRQLRSWRGVPKFTSLVTGTEAELKPEAEKDLKDARARGPVSLEKFMSGYGSDINAPRALWEKDVLARHSNKLTTYLMYVFLLAVMTLFLAAFVIEVYRRAAA